METVNILKIYWKKLCATTYFLYNYMLIIKNNRKQKKRGVRRRNMEGMRQTVVHCMIHGNVTMKPPVQLLYLNKKVKKIK
jgi:hypothetical protein